MKLKIIPHTIFIHFSRPLAIIVHYTVQVNLDCCKSSVPDMGPNTILKMKNIIKRRLNSEIKNYQLTILMKFGIPLAIIVHYPVLVDLECYKSSVSGMDPNTNLKLIKIIIRGLKSEIIFFQHTILMEYSSSRPLPIIVNYTVQFNLECCKSSGPDMGPNTSLNI